MKLQIFFKIHKISLDTNIQQCVQTSNLIFWRNSQSEKKKKKLCLYMLIPRNCVWFIKKSKTLRWLTFKHKTDQKKNGTVMSLNLRRTRLKTLRFVECGWVSRPYFSYMRIAVYPSPPVGELFTQSKSGHASGPVFDWRQKQNIHQQSDTEQTMQHTTSVSGIGSGGLMRRQSLQRGPV